MVFLPVSPYTTDGEPPAARPCFWQALRYQSAWRGRGLRDFVLSEGARYRDLLPASDDLRPRKAEGSPERDLGGWGFPMRTPEKDLGFYYYFQSLARRPRVAGWRPGASHRFVWFNPRTGKWEGSISLRADSPDNIRECCLESMTRRRCAGGAPPRG